MTSSYYPPIYDKMSVPELASCLKNLKIYLEASKNLKTLIQQEYDHLSTGVIPDRLDDEGIDSIKVKGIGRLQASSDIYCSVPKENKEALQEWLEDNDQGALIASTVNASTLKAYVKEQMKENKKWPKHLLKVTAYSRATVVKA